MITGVQPLRLLLRRLDLTPLVTLLNDARFYIKTEILCIKNEEFAAKTRNCVSKTRNFVIK